MVPKRGLILLKLSLACKVQPLKRPRTDLNHIYQPKDNQLELYEALAAYTPLLPKPIEEPVIIDMVIGFARATGPNPHKSDYPTAPKFGDEDNLRKAVNDALVVARIISNDRFVIGGETYKVFAEDDGAMIKISTIAT